MAAALVTPASNLPVNDSSLALPSTMLLPATASSSSTSPSNDVAKAQARKLARRPERPIRSARRTASTASSSSWVNVLNDEHEVVTRAPTGKEGQTSGDEADGEEQAVLDLYADADSDVAAPAPAAAAAAAFPSSQRRRSSSKRSIDDVESEAGAAPDGPAERRERSTKAHKAARTDGESSSERDDVSREQDASGIVDASSPRPRSPTQQHSVELAPQIKQQHRRHSSETSVELSGGGEGTCGKWSSSTPSSSHATPSLLTRTPGAWRSSWTGTGDASSTTTTTTTAAESELASSSSPKAFSRSNTSDLSTHDKSAKEVHDNDEEQDHPRLSLRIDGVQTYEQAQAKKQKQEHEQSDRIEPQGLPRGPSPSALAHLSTDTNPCTGTGGEGGAGDTSSADVSPLFASDEDGRTGQVASSQSSNDGGDDAAPPLLSQDKDDKREDDAGGDDEEERDVAPTTAAPRWAPALSFAQHRGTNARRPPSALSLNLGAGQTRESSIYSPPESVALGAQLSSDGSAPPLQGKTLIFPSPPSAASTTTTTTTTKSATTMSGQMLAIPPARGSMDGRLSPSSMSTSATAASSTSGRWTPKPLVLTPTRASVMPISRRVSTSSPLSPTASLGAQQQQPQPQDESPVLLGHARRHSAQAGLGIPPLSPVRGPRRRRSIGYGSISRLGAPMTPTDSQEPPSQPPRSATIPPPVPEKDTPPLLASSPPPRSRRSYSEDSPHMHELMKRASLAAAAARVRPHAAQDDDEEDRASEEERAERHSRLRDSLHVKADAEALLTRWREQLDELERAGAVPLGAAAHRRQVKSYAESVMTPAEHVREALDEAASDAQHDDDFVERVRAGLFAAGGERLDAPPPLQIRKNSRGASNVPVVDEQWRSSIISNLNHVIDAYASEDAPPVPAVPAQYERAVSQYEVFKGEDARSTSPSERGQSREHSTAFIDATRFSLEPDSVTPSTLNVSKSERSSAFRPDSIIDPSFLRTRTTTASTAATMMQDRLVSHFSEPSSRGSSPVPEPLEAAAPRPAKRPVMQHRLSGPRPAPFRRRSSGKVKRFGDPESWYSQSSDAAHSASATPSTMADRGEDLSTSPYPDLHASLEGGEDATETIEPHVSGLGFWGEHDDPEYGLASEARDEVDPYLDPSIPRAPIPVLPETQPLRVVAANNNAASRLSAVSEEPDMPEGATPLMDHLARRRPSAPSSDTRQANAVSLVFTEASPLSVSDAVFPSEHSQAPRSARVARDEDEGLIDLQLLLASPPPPLDELRPEDSPEEPYEPVFSEPRILSPAPGSVASSVASAPKLARAPSSSQRTRRTSTIGRKILRVFGGKQQHVPDSPDSGESWLEHPKASRSSAVRRASEANVATTPMAPTVRRASESTVMSAHDSPSSSGSLRSNSTNVPRHENGADAFNAASHRESKLSFMTALTSGSALSPIQSRTSYTSAHEAPSSSRWRSSSVPRTARRAESTSSLRSPSMVLPPGLGREEPPSMHARHSHLASAVSAPSAARAMSPAFSKDVFDELSSLTHSQPQAAPVQAQPPPPQRRRRRRQRVTRFADESSDEDSGTDGPSSGDEQDEDGDDFDLAKLPVIAPCRTPSPEPFSPELRATSPDGAATTTAAGRPLSLAAANMRASDAAMRALFRKQLAAF